MEAPLPAPSSPALKAENAKLKGAGPHESPGSWPCATGCRADWLNGSACRRGPNRRPASRGASPRKDRSDRSGYQMNNSLSSPNTTPKHFRSYHTTPAHSPVSVPPDGSFCPNYPYTRQHSQRCSLLHRYNPGCFVLHVLHTPTPPPWAAGSRWH